MEFIFSCCFKEKNILHVFLVKIKERNWQLFGTEMNFLNKLWGLLLSDVHDWKNF